MTNFVFLLGVKFELYCSYLNDRQGIKNYMYGLNERNNPSEPFTIFRMQIFYP